MIGATPLERPLTRVTYFVSTPKPARFLIVLSANISSPTLVTIITDAPSLAAATA